jgi:hypothetical protein
LWYKSLTNQMTQLLRAVTLQILQGFFFYNVARQFILLLWSLRPRWIGLEGKDVTIYNSWACIIKPFTAVIKFRNVLS